MSARISEASSFFRFFILATQRRLSESEMQNPVKENELKERVNDLEEELMKKEENIKDVRGFFLILDFKIEK